GRAAGALSDDAVLRRHGSAHALRDDGARETSDRRARRAAACGLRARAACRRAGPAGARRHLSRRSDVDRGEQLARLRDPAPFDVAVIGGGATGLGVALDAAARGFRVVLLEAVDFAKGT